MGWGGSNIELYNKDKEKSKKLKKHACMCDYETLSKKENGMRKYVISDIKPLLYIINNNNLK